MFSDGARGEREQVENGVATGKSITAVKTERAERFRLHGDRFFQIKFRDPRIARFDEADSEGRTSKLGAPVSSRCVFEFNSGPLVVERNFSYREQPISNPISVILPKSINNETNGSAVDKNDIIRRSLVSV